MGLDQPDTEAANTILEKLQRALQRLPLRPDPERPIAVAFSGGIDSTVLLGGLQRLGFGPQLSVWHIDHGLHADSEFWNAHCREIAAGLELPFRTGRVDVDAASGLGVEAAARAARYAAFADWMRPGQLLLTAHHGDDQLETVLLRLLRGSGVRGLRAIPEFSSFGPGFLARPLLDCSRAEIEQAAGAWRLSWLEDPANRDPSFDRSFLRAEVLPALTQRWPAAHRAARRLASHMEEAAQLLDALAEIDGGGHPSDAPFPLAALRALDPARQRNLLRYLIRARALPVPSGKQLESLRAALAVDRADAETCVRWPGVEAHCYDGRLYLLAALPAPVPTPTATLAAGRPWSGAAGRLSLEPCDGPGLPESWAEAGLEVRFRAGGERFKRFDERYSRTLKRCFQESHVVPWMRDRIPLLYRGDSLVAVADLWLADAAGRAEHGAPRWCVRWSDHPPIY